MATQIIRNLGGINRKDGADKVRDNQFNRLTNFVHTTKGLLYKVPESTGILTASEFEGLDAFKRCSGLFRVENPYVSGTLFHMNPDSTVKLPQPTEDLVLTDIPSSGGWLNNGGSAVAMRFCYTFVGLGMESNYNTLTRAGYVSTAGTNAWDQVGHQSITPSTATSVVRVTAPMYDNKYVRSINVYAARSNQTQMTYVGSIFEPGGTLDVSQYIGPPAAFNDSITAPTTHLSAVSSSTAGELKPGRYYVSFAWLTGSDTQERVRFYFDAINKGYDPTPQIKHTITVDVKPGDSSILVSVGSGLPASANGASALYVFVGRHLEGDHPFIYAASLRADQTFTILDINKNTNAATHYDSFNNIVPSHNVQNISRFGTFLFKNDLDDSITEVFPSRSEWTNTPGSLGVEIGEVFLYTEDDLNDISSYLTFQIRDNSATASGATFLKDRENLADPSFVQHQNGLVYMANGVNLMPCLSEYSIGFTTFQVSGAAVTVPRGRFIGYQNGQLIIGGAPRDTLIYASNSYAPRNWSAGGTGSQIRFMQAPDRNNQAVSGVHVYSYTTGDSGPQSYIAVFKKNSAWTVNAFADPTAGIGASFQQMAGRVGCLAYRSIVNTPHGAVFVGSDGDIYMIRGSGEPARIGTAVKPLLEHLANDENLMRMVTATFHDDFLKISYPSTLESEVCDAQIYADMRITSEDSITWSGPHTGNIGPQIVAFQTNQRLAASSVGPEAFKMDDIEAGFANESVIETKQFRFGAELNIKRVLGLYLDAYYDDAFSHEILVECFVDQEYGAVQKQLSNGSAVWGSSQWDQGKWSDALYQLVSCLFGDSNLVGRTVRFRITHMGSAQFILASIGMDLSAEKRKIV